MTLLLPWPQWQVCCHGVDFETDLLEALGLCCKVRYTLECSCRLIRYVPNTYPHFISFQNIMSDLPRMTWLFCLGIAKQRRRTDVPSGDDAGLLLDRRLVMARGCHVTSFISGS